MVFLHINKLNVYLKQSFSDYKIITRKNYNPRKFSNHRRFYVIKMNNYSI
jgi:hypothetical protein